MFKTVKLPLVLISVCGLLGSCASESSEKVEEVSYFKEVNRNACMKAVFPDFKVKTTELKYGKVKELMTDTVWSIKVENEHPIFSKDIRPPYVPEGASKNQSFKRYGFVSLSKSDSTAFLVFSPIEENSAGSERFPFGLSVFCKSSNGWYLKATDPNFYINVPEGQEPLYIRDIGSIDGGKAFFMLCETSSNDGGMAAYPKRSVHYFGYDLTSWIKATPKSIELDNPSESFISHALLNSDEMDRILSAVGVSPYQVPHKLLCGINSQGQMNYLRCVAKGNVSVPADSKAMSLPNGEIVMEGAVEERVGKRRNYNDPASTKEEFVLYRVPVGLWKNYLLQEAYFFTGTQAHMYAEGVLKDSAKVFAEGNGKLVARRQVVAEAAAEEASIRHERDKFFDRMKAQQDQDRAVDEVIRANGLCSYCSGRGCLQCAGTGKRQQ